MQAPDYYRHAAESLLGSQSSFDQHPLINNQSVNLIASEEAAAGWQRNGRMSSVRRFFCLYCTFDILFTALVWLISIMLTGENIADIWRLEVLGYTLRSSLLDVVAVAVVRFCLLLLAYAALHLDHWATVALTTSSTCSFLIAKVFLFDWTKSPQPVFEVLLVLLSFTLCWGEAWFLDCKVLPQEQHARHLLDSMTVAARIEGRRSGRPGGGPSDMTSIADFYSPAESSSSSPRLLYRGLSSMVR